MSVLRTCDDTRSERLAAQARVRNAHRPDQGGWEPLRTCVALPNGTVLDICPDGHQIELDEARGLYRCVRCGKAKWRDSY